MAVRFLPAPEERPTGGHEEREGLAEVIEFRARLKRPEPVAPQSGSGAAAVSELHGQRAASTRPAGGYPKVTRAMTAAEVLAAAVAGQAHRARPAAGGADEAPSANGASPEDCASGPSSYQVAIKLLARKAMSSGELRRALVDAEFSSGEVEEAVAECESSLYLDDAGLAASVTHKLRDSKGASQTVIRRKLRERLLPDSAIDAAIAELDSGEEYALLTQTAIDRARRLDGLDRQTAERRLLGFLARRGWTGERATRAAREALDGSRCSSRSGVRFE